MFHVRSICLLVALFGFFANAIAWQFSGQPMDTSECRPTTWLNTDEGEQYKQKYERLKQSHQQTDQCVRGQSFGSRAWHQCYDIGAAERKRIEQHYDSFRERAEPRFNQALKQCQETARHNAKVKEQNLALQHENERRQRDAQVAANNQRQAYERDMERMQREREREQARQPRVIAQTSSDSAYMTQRNEPRIAQTPQYQAQQQAIAEQTRQQQRVQEAQALSDSFKNLRQAFKQGQQTGATQAAGNSVVAAEVNAAINTGRGGSPIAGAIGGSALAATGGRNAQTMNSLDSTLKQMDQVTPNSSSGTTVASNNYRQPSSAMPAVIPSSSDSSAAGSTSPESACGNRVFLALQRCIVKQCALPQFASHPQCRNLSSSGNNNSSSIGTVENSGSAMPNNSARPSVAAAASAATIPPVMNAATGAAGTSSPEEACGRRVFLALQRCVVKQCETPQFAGHPQCKNLSPANPSVNSN